LLNFGLIPEADRIVTRPEGRAAMITLRTSQIVFVIVIAV
jgi:hypothetical protein